MKKNRFLFLITARGGSKGLPKKNILPLKGVPLIIYTLNAAREITNDENICVSTDSQEIINALEDYNYITPFIRPEYLANDTATSEDVIKHCINYYENIGVFYEYIVLLQPTSPLRTGNHIKEALTYVNESIDMIISVKETDSNPYYVLFEEGPNGILQKSKSSHYTRRQDLPKVYEANGAIYIIRTKAFLEKGISNLAKSKFVMDKMSSIDIDDILDFRLCEFILNEKNEI